MKKKSWVYALAVCLMAPMACSRDEGIDIPQTPTDCITFGVTSLQGGIVSRSTPLDVLPDGSSFGVLGYCLAQKVNDSALDPGTGPTEWLTKETLAPPHVFYKQKVTSNNGVCTYTPIKEWDINYAYKYTFFAYYPFNDGAGFTVDTKDTDTGAPEMTFSLPFDSDNKDTATELDDSTIPDAMVAWATDVTRNAGQVPLHFLHLLTGLNVRVNNYNEKEDHALGDSVVIHSLRLSGMFYKSIHIDFDNGVTFPDDTFVGTYRFLADGDSVVVQGGSSAYPIGGKTVLLLSNTSEQGSTNGYFGNNEVTVEYSFGESKHKTQTFSRPENFLPASGTIYTVQLNFIGDAFVLNCVVDNAQRWEDGGDSDITFE